MFVFVNIFIFSAYGQRVCGSAMDLDEIQQNDFPRYQRIMHLENLTNQYLISGANSRFPYRKIIIPVVVHIVYNNSTQNISDAQILSQIKVLNDDFRRENSDKVNTPSEFQGVAGSYDFEFKLAIIDPNGNTTNGITRTQTTATSFTGNDNVKRSTTNGVNAWDTRKYLNIWVCNLSGGLMGYAQFPSDFSTSPNTDGVVICYKYFGTNGTVVAPYNKGRTATHEVGHWLNLRHIWGDDSHLSDKCSGSDFVDDTPNQQTENYGCPSFPKKDNCTKNSPGVMYMNYMDYTDDGCMNLFTVGQVNRMLSLFDDETGIRKEMLTDALHLTTPPSPDLLVRDDNQDNGTEPNPRPINWNSPDIWLTLDQGNPTPIQNSDLHNHSNVFIAVKIKNIGNAASKGTEKLHVHWSKSTVNSRWKTDWTVHSLWVPWFPWFRLPKGAEITSTQGVNIPVLQPNESTTVYVEWTLPDYITQYNEEIDPFFKFKFKRNWGFALLARVFDGNYTYGLNSQTLKTTRFARENNNVAIDNGSLLLLQRDYSQLSYLEASFDKSVSISYNQIIKSDRYKLSDFAEVYALLSNDLMENVDWTKSTGIKRVDENRVFLASENSELVFKPLDSEKEVYFIGAEVNFISDKLPELNDFNFDLIYKEDGNEVETMRYTAIRDADVYFKAQAEASERKVVRGKGEVTLNSSIIKDVNTWYNEAGNVIGDGRQITITPEVSQKYKVEIFREEDGFKSYDEVEVIVVDGMIKAISPNPAQNYIRVDYELSDNATDASVQISNLQNTVSFSYPLSTTETHKEISLPALVSGNYIVKLIISSTVVDTQSLIIY